MAALKSFMKILVTATGDKGSDIFHREINRNPSCLLPGPLGAMCGCTTVSALARVPKHYSERGAHKRAGWTPLVYIAFLTLSKFRGMLPVGNLQLGVCASEILG